jgi:hypothetical protein
MGTSRRRGSSWTAPATSSAVVIIMRGEREYQPRRGSISRRRRGCRTAGPGGLARHGARGMATRQTAPRRALELRGHIARKGWWNFRRTLIPLSATSPTTAGEPTASGMSAADEVMQSRSEKSVEEDDSRAPFIPRPATVSPWERRRRSDAILPPLPARVSEHSLDVHPPRVRAGRAEAWQRRTSCSCPRADRRRPRPGCR